MMPSNSGQKWSQNEVNRLNQLARANTPTPLIAHELGRTPAAVQTKASSEGISLKPANRSPYTRKK